MNHITFLGIDEKTRIEFKRESIRKFKEKKTKSKKRSLRSVSFPISLKKYDNVNKKANEIFNAVNEVMNVSKEEILSKNRHHPVTDARIIAMALLYKPVEFGSDLLGIIFKRDHTTILYSVRQFNDLYKTDENFRNLADRIKLLLL